MKSEITVNPSINGYFFIMACNIESRTMSFAKCNFFSFFVGNCLEISEGELKNHSCYYFSEGCPDTKFWFYELYKCKIFKTH